MSTLKSDNKFPNWTFLPVREPHITYSREIHYGGCCQGEFILSAEELACLTSVLPSWERTGAAERETSNRDRASVSLVECSEASVLKSAIACSDALAQPANSLEDYSVTKAFANTPVKKFPKVKGLRISRQASAKEALLSPSRRVVSPGARAASFGSPKKAQGVSEDVNEGQPRLGFEIHTRNSMYTSPRVQKRKLSKAPHLPSGRGRCRPSALQSGLLPAIAAEAQGALAAKELDEPIASEAKTTSTAKETVNPNASEAQAPSGSSDTVQPVMTEMENIVVEPSLEETGHVVVEPSLEEKTDNVEEPSSEEAIPQWIPLSLMGRYSAQSSEDSSIPGADVKDISANPLPSEGKVITQARPSSWERRAMGCLLNRRPGQDKSDGAQLLKRRGKSGPSKQSGDDGDAKGHGAGPKVDLDAVLNAWL